MKKLHSTLITKTITLHLENNRQSDISLPKLNKV